MDSSDEPRLRNCEECGRVIEEDSHFCRFCGREKTGDEAKVEEERRISEMEKPLLPLAAGVLIIISSLLLLYTVWVSRTGPVDHWIATWFINVVYSWPLWFQILMVLSAVMGIIGGLSALFRRSQVIALIGAALSSLGMGAPLGLIALLLVAVSEHQFDSELADFTRSSESLESRRIEGFEFERRV